MKTFTVNHVSTPYASPHIIIIHLLATLTTTIFGDGDTLYFSIVSNNIFGNFGADTSNVMYVTYNIYF